MSSSRRLLFKVFAVVAALLLAGSRAERAGQPTPDGATPSFGEAARAFVIQAANTDGFRGMGLFSRDAAGLAPAPWVVGAASRYSAKAPPASVEVHGSMGVRVRRRILRMESDDPPFPRSVEVIRA